MNIPDLADSQSANYPINAFRTTSPEPGGTSALYETSARPWASSPTIATEPSGGENLLRGRDSKRYSPRAKLAVSLSAPTPVGVPLKLNPGQTSKPRDLANEIPFFELS